MKLLVHVFCKIKERAILEYPTYVQTIRNPHFCLAFLREGGGQFVLTAHENSFFELTFCFSRLKILTSLVHSLEQIFRRLSPSKIGLVVFLASIQLLQFSFLLLLRF